MPNTYLEFLFYSLLYLLIHAIIKEATLFLRPFGFLWVLALGPVLSRSLSGLAAVSWPNARGSGLLATFIQPMDAVKARGVLLVWVAVSAAAMIALDPVTGIAAVAGAGLSFLYYFVMSRRQFGGITGDLAGFFLQVCECAMVLAVVLAQRLEAVL